MTQQVRGRDPDEQRSETAPQADRRDAGRAPYGGPLLRCHGKLHDLTAGLLQKSGDIQPPL